MRKLSDITPQALCESRKIRERYKDIWEKIVGDIEYNDETYPNSSDLSKDVKAIIVKHLKYEDYDDEVKDKDLIKAFLDDVLSYLENDELFNKKTEY